MAIKTKSLIGTLLIFIFLLVSIGITVALKYFFPPSIPPELLGVLRPAPKAIASFVLTDQDNKQFDINRLKGKWSFIFFGYTHCPDACPTTFSMLAQVKKQLQQNPQIWSDSQVILVSVDPARDTPDRLAKYIRYFNKEFIAITGTKAEIDNLTHQFNAGYIIEPEQEPGSYLVSHTSSIFLSDPDARLVASFSQPHDPINISSLYRKIRSLF